MRIDLNTPPCGSSVPAHRVIAPSINYFGTPVALVTTLQADGTPNISPMSSAWALGDRIVLGMATRGQGVENAVREGQCVLNMAPAGLWRNVERLARTTGRHPVPDYKAAAGFVYEPDKFEAAGLTPLASHIVRPPRIADCPLQFEAEVVAAHAPGGGTWTIGCEHEFAILEVKVVRVHAHEEITIPGTNYVDVSKWQPLLYVFRHYVAAGEDLGRNFRAEA
jgi:flavin reductase (DIM6/NTAB) family NADH-FMN oxidoreductase RutF